MILQQLVAQYDRLIADGDPDLPPAGFSREKIHFFVRIDRDGRAIGTVPLDSLGLKDKRLDFQERIVPKYTDRTSGVLPFFLWDKTAYVLGLDPNAKPARLAEQFAAFKALHHQIGDAIDDPEMRAVLAFLDSWSPEAAGSIPGLAELIGGNAAFYVADAAGPVYENPVVRRAWLRYVEQQLGEVTGSCLATGERTTIARTHPSIRGVWGSQTSGAAIVSFNDDAYTSYGKKQSYNAPVGALAAEKYTKMLNHMLRRGSRSVARIGDTSVVFWCEAHTPMERSLGALLGSTEDPIDNETIRSFLLTLKTGGRPKDFEPDRAFFILGLAAPSKSRLSVRYWYQGTTGELAARLARHLTDTDIVTMWDDDPDPPIFWQFLTAAVLGGDTRNLKPRMEEALIRAALFGEPYPRRLYQAMLERIRVGDQRWRAYDSIRARLIRGYLQRATWNHTTQRSDKEIPVALQTDMENAAYQFGRLFAVYERIQRASVGSRPLNRTIKDRFYAAAATAPARTFAVVDRLSVAHQKKLDRKLRGFYGAKLEEIMSRFDPRYYPVRFSLDEQGLFALGYYHQRKDLFTKREDTEG